jgi:hypothetical protein
VNRPQISRIARILFSAITRRDVKTISPAAHRVVSGRAQDRRLPGHRAADDDGKFRAAAAERGHHPARRASGGHGTNSAETLGHRPRGRARLVIRYGRYFLFSLEKLEKAERWSAHYGAMGVFIARLLPGARQLVGIPAGVARMDYKLFSVFTLLGSTIWCAVLCYVGVKAGQDEKLMHGEMRHVAVWLGGAVLVLGGLYYFFVHRHMKKKP